MHPAGGIRPAREHTLPVVLGVDKVQRILGCLHLPRYRVCLSTIYTCGLRLQEGVYLQVPDIDSDRMLVHVRHGKGSKDRSMPLPECTLLMLRQYRVTHRHALWLFPGRTPVGLSPTAAARPMDVSGVQRAFRALAW